MFIQTSVTMFKTRRNSRQDNEFRRFTIKLFGIPVFFRTEFKRILRKTDSQGRHM